MKLSIETRTLGERGVVLVLRGEVDYASAQQLRAAITAALSRQVDRLVINLADVAFLDSTGIGTLVVARRICDGVRVDLQVREANPFIARLFEVVGVAEALGIEVPAGAVVRRAPRPRPEAAPQPV